ncbi:hypothetical protein B0F90DRAFT_1709029, partial [Multifurca ochricompacta]
MKSRVITTFGYYYYCQLSVFVGGNDRVGRGRSGLRRPKVSRKEARKQDREEKKRRKAEYFSSTSTDAKRIATSPHPEVLEPPRPQVSGLEPSKNLSGFTSKHAKSTATPQTASSLIVNRLTLPNPPRSQQEEDEDRYIAFLEAKLNPGR